MKKHVSFLLKLLLLSVGIGTASSSFAQTQVALLRDADWEVINRPELPYNSINGHSNNDNFVKLDDNSTVALVKNKKGEFAVSNISDNMAIRWRSAVLPGFPFGIGLLKGNILVVAADDKTYFTSFGSTYSAFLVDPLTGKILLQKQIYKGGEEFMEYPHFMFSETGDFFRYSVRVSGIARRLHVGIPVIGALVTNKSLDGQFPETKSFNIYTLNEKLENELTVPVTLQGIFAGIVSNKDGDALLLTLKDRSTIIANRYEPGKKASSKTVTMSVGATFKGFFFNAEFAKGFRYTNSSKDPLQVYWTLVIKDNSMSTLYLGSMNLNDGKSKVEKQIYTGKSLKGLEDSYVRPDKKIDKPDFDSAPFLRVTSIYDAGDKIMISVGNRGVTKPFDSFYFNHFSEILMAFNASDLKQIYQVIIPRIFTIRNYDPKSMADIAYHYSKDNVVTYIANTDRGQTSVDILYGQFDLITGKSLKTILLPKGKVDDRAMHNGTSVIWNNDSFILPYFDPKGIFKISFDIDLAKYTY
jgi:hypothetical protein